MHPPANHLFERLQDWADRFPDRPAHVAASAGTTPTLTLTYRELLARARAVAAGLSRRLPDDGSPVIVLGHKEPEMLAGFLGAVGAGIRTSRSTTVCLRTGSNESLPFPGPP